MSAPNLPPIFLPSGSHGELLLGTADMWEHPEGRYVAASEYLELKTRCASALRMMEQLEVLKKAGVTELIRFF